MGNNFFQIAATCAHAWDHFAEPIFPDLATKLTDGMPTNYAHVFFRVNATNPNTKIKFSWSLPVSGFYCYTPIPYIPNMQLAGTFQSEKFFAHHRQRLLELFAPREDDLEYIKHKYSHILNHPMSVGIQIRWFGVRSDEGWWGCLAQYGYDFFVKAIAQFPKDSLFVVSTNNLEFAKANLPKDIPNVIFLEGEPHYIDFYILSMCKHDIISNSSFGWWAAWLNQNVNKKVVVPKYWIDPTAPVAVETWPVEWVKIDAKWGKPQDDIMSFR